MAKLLFIIQADKGVKGCNTITPNAPYGSPAKHFYALRRLRHTQFGGAAHVYAIVIAFVEVFVRHCFEIMQFAAPRLKRQRARQVGQRFARATRFAILKSAPVQALRQLGSRRSASE